VSGEAYEDCSCSYCADDLPRLKELSAPELCAEPSYPSHGYYLVLWSEDKKISVDTVICIDGKNAKKIDENNSDEQYSEEQGFKFFKIYESIDPKNLEKSTKGAMDWSELNGNSSSIDIEIEIYASNKKLMESPMLAFHASKEGFVIGCKGSKKYFIDKDIIAKESDIFRNLSKNASQLILNETDSITLETFLTYCYSGYIPLKFEVGNIEIFVEKYNVTNLKDLMDRYLSLTLTGKTAKNWIPWAINLKMENTALRIYQMRAEAKQALAKVWEQKTILFSKMP
jgi:hypothetical protein